MNCCLGTGDRGLKPPQRSRRDPCTSTRPPTFGPSTGWPRNSAKTSTSCSTSPSKWSPRMPHLGAQPRRRKRYGLHRRRRRQPRRADQDPSGNAAARGALISAAGAGPCGLRRTVTLLPASNAKGPPGRLGGRSIDLRSVPIRRPNTPRAVEGFLKKFRGLFACASGPRCLKSWRFPGATRIAARIEPPASLPKRRA